MSAKTVKLVEAAYHPIARPAGRRDKQYRLARHCAALSELTASQSVKETFQALGRLAPIDGCDYTNRVRFVCGDLRVIEPVCAESATMLIAAWPPACIADAASVELLGCNHVDFRTAVTRAAFDFELHTMAQSIAFGIS